MTGKPTAADRLRARIAGISTPLLINLHGKTLAQGYAAAKKNPADADPYIITVEYITDELEQRGVEFNLCCYCPKPHHDERTCDRNGPTPVTEAADMIMKGLGRVR